MSDELEEELGKMRQEGSLTEEFEQQRKREHIQSARNMLRELDLKLSRVAIFRGYMQNTGITVPNYLNSNLNRKVITIRYRA